MVTKGRYASRSHRAQRTGLYAESKWTNWRPFDPFKSDAYRILFQKHFDDMTESRGPLIRAEPVSSGFIMPITADDVQEFLNLVPKPFLAQLRGIFLLGGSRKQLKACDSNLFCFGCYGNELIFILPFPEAWMETRLKRLPPPHKRHEYERAGAIYEPALGGWLQKFSLDALRRYYLYEVLAHELGHHVDQSRSNNQSYRNKGKAESFANWFACEFGYKLATGRNDGRL